ncbi:MAG TPA: hypothetical protein VD815_02140 [Candidatus Saccharimonadales bacterium]|nr:hypothetical protein [Candidatus Saccharimonadales bacterium]
MSIFTPTTTTNNSYSNPDNKQICNAYGCPSVATDTVCVDGGQYGTIILRVCSVCRNKFSGGVEVE